MKGFHHLYASNSLKISYVILIVIIFGIGFYFVSMPELKNEPVTETRTTIVSTTTPIIFVPSSEAEHKLVMFTSITPMWEFSLQENSFIGSPEDGSIHIITDNRFLISSGDWALMYILGTSENIGSIDKNVKARDPIIKSNSGTFLFGAAKNCDITRDVFLNCKFVDPMEYFDEVEK